MAGAVEFKPLFTGILGPGRFEVYECPAQKQADVIIVRLKNKSASQVQVAVNGIWGQNEIEQFPDGYVILPGQIAQDLNFKLFFDGGGKLVITIGAGGLIHCYIGGMERAK